MKYVVVSKNMARGRGGSLFTRIEFARAPEATTDKKLDVRDAVLSITTTDQDGPLWTKNVDDTVEVD